MKIRPGELHETVDELEAIIQAAPNAVDAMIAAVRSQLPALRAKGPEAIHEMIQAYRAAANLLEQEGLD